MNREKNKVDQASLPLVSWFCSELVGKRNDLTAFILSEKANVGY